MKSFHSISKVLYLKMVLVIEGKVISRGVKMKLFTIKDFGGVVLPVEILGLLL